MFNQATIDNLTFEEKIHFDILPNSLYEIQDQMNIVEDEYQGEIEELEGTIEKLQKRIKELEASPPQEKLFMSEESEKEKNRVIFLADQRKEFIVEVDGFTYWVPSEGKGYLAAHHLRWIAEELDKRNKEINAAIDAHFKTSPLG